MVNCADAPQLLRPLCLELGVGDISWRQEWELEGRVGGMSWSWRWRQELEGRVGVGGMSWRAVYIFQSSHFAPKPIGRRGGTGGGAVICWTRYFMPPFSCFTSPSTESSRCSRAPMRFTSSSLFSNISRKTLVAHYPCHSPSKGILCKFCTKLLLFKSIAHYSPP